MSLTSIYIGCILQKPGGSYNTKDRSLLDFSGNILCSLPVETVPETIFPVNIIKAAAGNHFII